MLNRGSQRDAAAERIAHDIGLREPELLDERGDIVGHRLVGERAVDIGGAPVPLQIDSDDLAPRRELRQHRTEHFDSAETAVQQ